MFKQEPVTYESFTSEAQVIPGGRCVEHLSGGMQLLDYAPVVLASLNIQGYLVYLNNTWETLLGYSREDCIHKPIAKFLYCDDSTKINFEQIRPTSGSAIKIYHLPLVCKSGEIKEFEYAACHMGTSIYAYLSPSVQSSQSCTRQLDWSKPQYFQQEQMNTSKQGRVL